MAPPAISGGTLRVLADKQTAVAADPDRDQVYIVDLSARTLTATVVLDRGDEPGRVIEDAAGRVHIALRHGGAVVTIDPATGAITQRRPVCAAPRGLAYDAATDLVHVACAGGELVSIPAAGGAAVRSLMLDRDLRDVIVDGSRLRISRFRSAELLTVDAKGSVAGRTPMPSFRSTLTRGGQRFSPAVAWRTMEMPMGGIAMLHQRGVDDQILPVVGGYGHGDTCNTIVHPAITIEKPDGTIVTGPALAGLVVAVDMAISSDGSRVAIVSPGNAHNSPGSGFPFAPQAVFVTDMASATDESVGCRPDGRHGPCGGLGSMGLPLLAAAADTMGGTGSVDGSGGTDGSGGGTAPGTVAGSGGISGTAGRSGVGGRGGVPTSIAPSRATTSSCGTPIPQVTGEPIAVAFMANGDIVVQSREPAVLSFADGAALVLSTDSRNDTGHLLFHANAGSFLACASCHAEGKEDGRVWNLACEGPRRTQSLQTGLAGTEPFHWNGDEKDFPQLVSDVFTGRMSGPTLAPDQVAATLKWIDAQPRVPQSAPTDSVAVTRGRALFNDQTRAGCVTCHAGTRLTNNSTVDVGTGGRFQVPSLVGVSGRAPYIHDGCAATLRDRFSGACGGGDQHGVTSILSQGEMSDLITYIETL